MPKKHQLKSTGSVNDECTVYYIIVVQKRSKISEMNNKANQSTIFVFKEQGLKDLKLKINSFRLLICL